MAAMMNDVRADRLRELPPFLFNEITLLKNAKRAQGVDVIDLGVGDPDRPTPDFIIEEMDRAMRAPANHRYPDFHGMPRFRRACAAFMLRRFGVTVDPDRHVLALMGGKDGISHLPLGLLNAGEASVICPPAYPVYEMATLLAGGGVIKAPVSAQSGWLPTREGLDGAVGASRFSPKLLWLNYPNNPTGAAAGTELFGWAAEWCRERGAVLASDLAYSEVYFNGAASAPVSMWQGGGGGGGGGGVSLDGFKGIEFHSLSKSFNMTGWRLGFAVGHPEVVGALRQVKDNYDSGPFNAVQEAGALALERFDDPAIEEMRSLYRSRRDMIVPALREMGCMVEPPRSGFFVWARCPAGPDGEPMDSMAFARRCLDECGVVVVPGAGFCSSARQWFRVALSVPTERVEEGMARLSAMPVGV